LEYASSYGLGVTQISLTSSRNTHKDIGVTLNITDLTSKIRGLEL